MEGVGVGVVQQGTIEGAHGEFNAVVCAGFAHEASDVGFDGTFFNAELAGDFTV